MNKLRSLISILLILCLSVTSILPTTIFASSNGDGGSGSYTPGNGSWAGSGNSVIDTKGGWRFSLLFLSGDAGGANLIDSVGNVNIDAWEANKNYVQV